MGTKLCCFPTTFVACDIETTGLSPKDSEIIEIGAVRFKDGKMVEQFNTLIKPTSSIPPFITSLTGINNDMVKSAPCIEDVMKWFIEFIGDDILVAHNASFDLSFLYEYAKRNGLYFGNDYVDTLQLARRICPSLPNKKLSTLVEYYKIKHQNTHRATDDAIACGLLLECLKKDCA